MGKATFRTFATFIVLLLVLATVFTLTFGLCDAHIFAPLDVASAASTDASASADYYASVEGLSTNGSAFRSSLAALIKHDVSRQSSYSGLINVFPDTDANPNNKSQMLWYYTGTVAKSGTNREHVWPKDGGRAFPEKEDAGSDAHHLRPTDQQLNSSRGSLSFGEVSQVAGNIVKEYGSTTYSNLCYKTSQYFYPGVGYRGSTARILMYVQTRWGDQYNLQFVLGAGNCKTIGDIETLMKWHLEEPVTEAERLRNDEVYKLQGNRNPFIDHPEYAERIYCYDGKSYNSKLQDVVAKYGPNEPIEKLSFKETDISLGVGETTNITPTYAPTNAKREVNWTSSNTSVASVDANGKVTAIANGTTTITVSSKENPSINATVTVTVKSVTSISVSGTPTKTTYNDGEAFSPSGITVTARFSDGTSKVVENTSCQWLDGVTRAGTLSFGSTSVICKYGAFEAVINGITVNKVVAGTKTTINLASTSSGTKYDWYGWEADGVQGKVYMYKNSQKTAIQMNNKSGVCCYLYNTTAAPNNILSITITLKDGSDKTFEVRTSSTPFSDGTSQPTSGKSVGTISASTNATTLKVDSTDKYFAVCYTGTGVCYIESIEILYGQASSECEHTYGEWTTTKEATATENGEKTRTCTKCGHVETQVIPATGGTTECDHSYGDWTISKEATATENGEKTRTCTKCGHIEIQVIPALGGTTECDHSYGDWIISKEATATENGEKTRTCTKCGHVETQVIPATGGTTGGEYTAEDFVNAVNAIESAATDEDKAALIAYAESIYNALGENQAMQIESQNAFLQLCEQKDKLQQKLNQLADEFKLSGGEIAGIVVGCVAFVAIVAVVVVVLVNNGKKNKTSRS